MLWPDCAINARSDALTHSHSHSLTHSLRLQRRYVKYPGADDHAVNLQSDVAEVSLI